MKNKYDNDSSSFSESTITPEKVEFLNEIESPEKSEGDDRNINVLCPIHEFNKDLPIRHLDEINAKYDREYDEH